MGKDHLCIGWQAVLEVFIMRKIRLLRLRVGHLRQPHPHHVRITHQMLPEILLRLRLLLPTGAEYFGNSNVTIPRSKALRIFSPMAFLL